MKPIKMKPATIARRAAERTAAQAERRAILLSRLEAKAKAENDPAGFWAGLLAEAVAA